MPTGFSARALVRIALVLLLVGAGAAVWELLARQVPGTPFHLSALPGPIESFRLWVTGLALVLLAAAWLLPWAYGAEAPRALLAACFTGVGLTVGAAFVGALRGMYLVQMFDDSRLAMGLFAVKILGHLLLGACLIDLARRILFRPPAG